MIRDLREVTVAHSVQNTMK